MENPEINDPWEGSKMDRWKIFKETKNIILGSLPFLNKHFIE